MNLSQRQKMMEINERTMDSRTEMDAKDLAEDLYEYITDVADEICVDRKWYFEKVVHYMTAEGDEEEKRRKKYGRKKREKAKCKV